jgi:hypothetical protein
MHGMDKAKQFLMSLFGLLIALICLMVILRLLSHVPVIGKIAEDAQHLATEGTLA